MANNHAVNYWLAHKRVADLIDWETVDILAERLAELRDRQGVLYVVGLGGSMANAQHMAADLRKLCFIDARSQDNMAEMTARANDTGWSSAFDGLLINIKKEDALFVLSVGGGTHEVSTPITCAILACKATGMEVYGIVGPNGGATKEHGDLVITIPAKHDPTPHTESFQAVLWHCLVTNPILQKEQMKWK